MALPVFPVLPGQGWGIKKTPVFSTRVSPHVSGRETRAALYARALYEFELLFNGLDSSGSYPGLTANSLQTLMGFYLQAQGQAGTFLYIDPTDFSASGTSFGTADGTSTSYYLQRPMGSVYEPISYALTPTALTQVDFGPEGGGVNYLPNNLIANSATSSTWSNNYNLTPTTGQTDPFGGSLATLLREAAVTNFFSSQLGASGIPAGAFVIYSTYLKPFGGTQYWLLQADGNPDFSHGFSANFDLINGLVAKTNLSHNGGGPMQIFGITPAANGWFRCWIGGDVAAPDSAVRFFIAGAANSASPGMWFPSYTGNTSNGVYAAFPQIDVVTSAAAARAFVPTFGAVNYGSPAIFLNGVPQNPSTFSFASPNGVTFNSAPTAGAALSWTGTYGYQCRFLDDSAEFERIMAGAWQQRGLKFRSVR